MMNLKLIFLTLFLLLQFHFLQAQETAGTGNGIFSGLDALYKNPASVSGTGVYLDFQLFNAGVYFQNNYFYISKDEYKFTRFFDKNPQFPKHGHDSSYLVYSTNNIDNKNAYINTHIALPSFLYTDGKFVIYLTTNNRFSASMNNVPYHIANFAYYGWSYKPQQKKRYISGNYRLDGLAWNEIGLGTSYIIRDKRYDFLSAGISIKRLFGYAGFYYNNSYSDYEVISDDSLQVNHLTAKYGYALPLDYNNKDVNVSPDILGYGWSADIGFTYKRKENTYSQQYNKKACLQKGIKYKYSIGVSLLDIGRIKFTKKVRELSIKDKSTQWNDVNSFDFHSINSIDSVFLVRFYQHQPLPDRKKYFSIGLPSAVSIQFDYHFYKGLYFNITTFKSIPFGKQYVERLSLISLTPRYESMFFEVNLPVTLYEHSPPQIGLSLRIWNFTIGSDKISGFFSHQNFTGLDLYCSLKFTLFKSNCKPYIFRFHRKSPCEIVDF